MVVEFTTRYVKGKESNSRRDKQIKGHQSQKRREIGSNLKLGQGQEEEPEFSRPVVRSCDEEKRPEVCGRAEQSD